MKTKKQTKHQKPIEFDIHLKYKCNKCGYDHWLSYREASTKNFKFVCDCGKVYRPKRVVGFKLKYENLNPQPKVVESTQTNTPTPEPISEILVTQIHQPEVVKTIPEPSEDLLNKASQLLTSYGFTQTEAYEVIKKVYGEQPVDDYVILVKNILTSLRN